MDLIPHARAMVAAKLANMPSGYRTDLQPSENLPKVSQSAAAEMLNVSDRSIRSKRLSLFLA
jgi:hypothetical protein